MVLYSLLNNNKDSDKRGLQEVQNHSRVLNLKKDTKNSKAFVVIY